MGAPDGVWAVLVAALLGAANAQTSFQGCATTDGSDLFLARVSPELSVCAAGASLPASLYELTTFAYSSRGKASYTATGSTNGKNSANLFTVDFAGSDSLISNALYTQSPDLQMYPATAAAVVPVYNLAELGNNTLVLDRSVLPKIFLGDIFLWNDTQILDLQDATTRALLLSLEDQLIKPVVRDDGSGTTAIFTKALNLFSPSTDGPLSFGARIGADDVVDWCEDGMEDILCAGTIDATTGVCSTNPSKFNCFGVSGECEGVAGPTGWQRETGFSTSGKVTCEKAQHGGRRWSYYRGATTVGLLAAVLQLPGSVGYSVLADTVTLSIPIARMKNKAGTVVAADSESVSFALLELGGNFDARGTADLFDASSTFAWPIAGYTYHVTRKGLDDDMVNHMTGPQQVMFKCSTRNETFKYFEWFYTSPTPNAIAEQLGFTNLPSFIADTLVEDMLQENYCQDAGGSPRLAKAITQIQFNLVFISDMSTFLLDTYVNVYKEVDPLVLWSYKVMPSGELGATLLQTGTYTDSAVTSASLASGLGIAHIAKSAAAALPTNVVVTPFYAVGIAVIYHLKDDESLDLAASLRTLRDAFLLTGNTFAALDTTGGAAAFTGTFRLVIRSDDCDTTEILTAGLIRHFGCAAGGSGVGTPICACLGGTPFRQLSAAYFDGTRANVGGPGVGCGTWNSPDDVVFVDSEPTAKAAVTYYPRAIGFWAQVGTLENVKALALSDITGLTGNLEIGDASLKACDTMQSRFTVRAGTAYESSLFDTMQATSPSCWPFARLYSLVIRQLEVTSKQCPRNAFFAGEGQSLSAEFAQYLFSSDEVLAAVTNLGLVPVDTAGRDAASDLLTFDCTPASSACPAGSYFDADAGKCKNCAVGSIASSSGQTQCQECPPGSYESNRKVCLLCASDEYQPEAGQSSCLRCVDNSLFLEESEDATIPFIPRQGAALKSQCACIDGFYAPRAKDLGEECLPCPVGAVCKGTGFSARIVPVPQGGWYFREAAREVMLKCLSPLACPGGALNLCGDGYVGDLCAQCEENYFSSSGSCSVCKRGNQVAGGIAMIMFVIIAVALHYIANIDRTGSLMRSTTAAAAEVQSMILFLQIFNLFLVVRVNWPPEIRELMGYFAWVNIDLSILSLECTIDIDYVENYRLKVLFPFVFVGFYVLYTLGFWAYFVYKFPFSVAVKEAKLFIFKSLNASCLITSILYLSTTKTIMEAFTCTRQPDGSLTMPLYPALECNSPEYFREVQPVAVAGLILVGLGYPILLFVVFFAGYDTMSEAIFISTQIMRAPFKKKFYFWEVVDLLRKFIIALMLSAGGVLTTGTQLAGLSIIMIAALMVQVFYRPFKHLNVNSLVVYIFSVLLFVLITAGMIFNESASDNSNALRTGLTILTYIVVVSAIVLSLGNVALAIMVFRKTRMTGEVVQHQVLITPELLDMTVEQLREVQSENVIAQCKEIIDDEDMQRSFNDAVCLLFVLSSTSKRGGGSRRSNKKVARTDSGDSSLSFADHHTLGNDEDDDAHDVEDTRGHAHNAQARASVDNKPILAGKQPPSEEPSKPAGLQHIDSTKILNQFGSSARVTKLSKQVAEQGAVAEPIASPRGRRPETDDDAPSHKQAKKQILSPRPGEQSKKPQLDDDDLLA